MKKLLPLLIALVIFSVALPVDAGRLKPKKHRTKVTVVKPTPWKLVEPTPHKDTRVYMVYPTPAPTPEPAPKVIQRPEPSPYYYEDSPCIPDPIPVYIIDNGSLYGYSDEGIELGPYLPPKLPAIDCYDYESESIQATYVNSVYKTQNKWGVKGSYWGVEVVDSTGKNKTYWAHSSWGVETGDWEYHAKYWDEFKEMYATVKPGEKVKIYFNPDGNAYKFHGVDAFK
jgi:hypothetical protein